jgi:cytochrome c-type biogenesis protein CcmH
MRYCLITLSLLCITRVAFAQNATPSPDDVNRVARQLYCPVCENVPLDVCPTQACADWRADIYDKLAQGWTDEQIKDYFAQQHGDRVLARPPARGLNLAVYVVPPLALLMGGLLLYRYLHARRPVTVPAAEAPLASDYQARLEKELNDRF